MAPSQFDDDAGIIVVADHAESASDAVAAVATADGRLLSVISWNDALERIALQAAPTTILLETQGVADEVVALVFPKLVEIVGANHTLIAFSLDRLDQLDAILMGSGAALLCDATITERVAALIMAVQSDHIELRENRDEVVRLARISAEIARFTETLAHLTGAPQGARAAIERQPLVMHQPEPPGLPDGAGEITAAELRRAIRARRLRDEVVGQPGLFEDPAWDMMLDLFAAELERRQVSVSSLCIAAAVAPTTALRWINKMIAVDLFERRPDDFDRRRAYVALTDRAVTALHNYFAALRRAGLSIA